MAGKKSIPDALQDRAALARAITLAESTREDHREQSLALVESILPMSGNSLRIGITGVPGVGKSTFIEAFGLHAIAQGHKVAVLAIDPSSAISGGSILGDKTRMAKLAQHEKAFIRPTPASGMLGGVARHTREAILLCEAAGYDIIIVETVGVGQSETEVAQMTDMFMLLLLPGSGDEIQGIKKGIVELADLILVNKADGDLLPQARRVQADYAAALKLLHPPRGAHWAPKVLTCSALSGDGIPEIWGEAGAFGKTMRGSGAISARRAEQAKDWMWKEIREMLLEEFYRTPGIAARIAQMESAVMNGAVSPTKAAQMLVKA